MFQLDLHSRLPIYEQLQEQIGRLVISGQLAPNDQLPSVRSIARDLGINPNTVQKAYQQLEREGIIYTVAGKGCFVSDRDLTGLLQQPYLTALYQNICNVKNVGIGLEQVMDLARQIYKEESDD